MTGRQLHKNIAAYIRSHYKLEAVKQSVLFVFFSALLWLFVLMTEYALWLPATARKILFWGSWTVQVLLLLRYGLFPWLQYAGLFRRMTAMDVARQLAGTRPGLADKLINFLQLEKLPDADHDLLAYELERREKELLRFNLRQILPSRRYWRYVYLLLIPLFAGALFRLQAPLKGLAASYQRLEYYNRPFQRPAPFSVDIISPLRAIPGHPYTLKVRVSGDVLPENLEILRDNQRQTLRRTNDTVFVYEMPEFERATDFELLAGKYRFGPFRIEAVAVPAVDSFYVNASPPPYLGRKQTQTFRNTDLNLPEGSHIRWHLFVSKSHLASINKHDSIRLHPTGDSLKWDLLLRRDTTLRFTFINQNSGQSIGLFFHIHSQPDLPPELQVHLQADTSLYAIRHLLLMQGDDDKGLSSLLLHYRTPGGKEHTKTLRHYGGRKTMREQWIFPYDFHLPDTLRYTYYFTLADNNTATGPRTARSPVFVYHPRARNATERQKHEQQTLQNAGKQLQQFGKQTKQIDRSLRELRTRKTTDWQFQNRVADNLQQSARQKKELLEMNRRLKEMLRQAEKQNPDNPQLKALKKRLAENERRLKNDSLEQQLQKLLNQLNREKLLDQLEKLENQNRLEKRSMERMLEMVKRFYIEQHLKQMADSLSQLARRQEKLARTDQDTPGQQQKLNRRTDSLHKQFQSLQQMNRSLKEPVQMPPLNAGFKTAKMFQKQAGQQMQQSPSKANTAQQRAAEQLQQMSSMLQAMAMNGQREQHQEDLNQIKSLIKTLLDISFMQEKLFDYDPANPYDYSKLLLTQNRLRRSLERVSDSLDVIALRQPALSEDLFDELNNALYHSRKTLDLLQDVKFSMVRMHQKNFFSNINRLIYLLNLFLDTQSRPKMGMGQGQGSKSQGQSLPDKIRKKSNQIKQGMEQMMRQGTGQKGRGEKMSKRAWQLYKEQQQLKDMLRQFEGEHPDKRIRELNKKLDELSKQVLRKGLNKKLYEQILQLQYELLKLVKATYKQHQSEKRLSHEGKFSGAPPDSLRLELFRKYFPQYEQLKRFDWPLTKDYERIYRQYKNRMQ